jgi:hypothetical protein
MLASEAATSPQRVRVSVRIRVRRLSDVYYVVDFVVVV